MTRPIIAIKDSVDQAMVCPGVVTVACGGATYPEDVLLFKEP